MSTKRQLPGNGSGRPVAPVIVKNPNIPVIRDTARAPLYPPTKINSPSSKWSQK